MNDAAVPPRLAGLDPGSAQRVVAAARALSAGRVEQAQAVLGPVLEAAPGHPEVLRLQAGLLSRLGRHAAARTAMQRAVALRPRDSLYQCTLGEVLAAAGDPDTAIAALRRACALQPDLAAAWYDLAVVLNRCVRGDEADAALQRAAKLDPRNPAVLALRAERLRINGQTAGSASGYRQLLALQPWSGTAWWGLADLRGAGLRASDLEPLRAALRDPRATDDDRVAMGFALARLLDARGAYRQSLAELERANALARARQRWHPREFSAWVRACDDAFASAPEPDPGDRFGSEVIFITGMPRSGTTLTEQILAAHSRVAASGELPDLPQVLAEESRRAGVRFPGWVRAARPDDWRRLGDEYLQRTARWRRDRPVATDKLPSNWTYIGAIRRMLPGAHVIVCRRDPLETCFGCYRQRFVGNEYTRTFADLASFWRVFDHTASRWVAVQPSCVYQHVHERLQAEPESGIRDLLRGCALPFERACLRFHESARAVYSPSASQVRRPLQRDTAHANAYGALLDPLRACLGLPTLG